MLAPLLLAALPLATPRVAPAVVARLQAGEAYVPVVLTLRVDGTASGSRREALGRAAEDALAGLDVTRFAPRHRLLHSPVVSGSVTRSGLEELRNRPGVASISEDLPVRPAGQLGGAQIGTDRLSAMGLTGYGRTVAIVDSGIDADHPFLGGGPGPSPRVLGGWNAADGGTDLSDCNGHGTAVAGVAAGLDGVAPEAGIVAVKVFSRRDGCDFAALSDVLAGVDWVIDHREELRIDVINLSLTGDESYNGFCDADDPAGREVFARAREAGIAVVAAAGNSGWSDAVSWPACLSDVAAIGMVFSRAVEGVSGAGSTGCHDTRVEPDVVPCASNSGSQLAALAPGVNWTTAVAGGGLAGFTGTSAAAPAAAGALLLARQVRPTLDPALSLGLLAASGTPVVDAKSGRVTPRLDVAAAVDAVAPFTGPCSSSAIPLDGTPLVCRSRIDAVTGDVVSLVAALTIDHPDPARLLVRLLGPDGTSAVLMDGFGSKARAVRAVFGRTAVPAEPLSRFTGRPSAGTWRLEITDRRGSATGAVAGRLVSWALQLEPEGPDGDSGRLDGESLLPMAVRGAGRFGAFWDADLRLFNAGPTTASVKLRFAERAPGYAQRTLSLTIPPLGTRAMDGLVGDAFRSNGTGPVFLDAAESVLGLGLVRSSAPAGGRYSSPLPTYVRSRALASGAAPRRFLVPVGDGFRVNVGLVEVAGGPATVEVSLLDRSGMLKSLLEVQVGALSTRQVNGVADSLGTPMAPDDRLELRVVAGGGQIVPFVTALENATSDPIVLYGATKAAHLLLPSVIRETGADGFRTDLSLGNASALAVRVRATFRPTSGTATPSVIVPIGPGDTRFLEDALPQLFGAAGTGRGSLELESLDGPAILAASRTWHRTAAGRPGFSLEGVVLAEGGAGDRLALPFVTRGSEIGLLETAGATARVRLVLLGADGTARASSELRLGPREVRRVADVFSQLEDASDEEATLLVEVLQGGAVSAYVLRQDERTHDAVVFPALAVP